LLSRTFGFISDSGGKWNGDFGSPNSPGVTQGTAKDTLLAEYNNIEQVEDLFRNNPEQIAAIIVEPIAGNMGCILPRITFFKILEESVMRMVPY
jgi:glutamate-1-semialdehyde 2,1-aminomutase